MCVVCVVCGAEFTEPKWKTHCLDCYDKHLRKPKRCCDCGKMFTTRYDQCIDCYIISSQKKEKELEELMKQREYEESLEPENLLKRIENLERIVSALID